VIDAHVHLAFAGPEQALAGGVVAVRDLGAPLSQALAWRTGPGQPAPGLPAVAGARAVLNAPEGDPAGALGAGRGAPVVGSVEAAAAAVRALAVDGVDVIKIALEPGAAGWPVPPPPVVRAAVETAHDLGLPVVAHALAADLVTRALDAGIDELAHTPVE